MLRLIWQYVRSGYTRHRTGLDTTDIQHLRADLRFRLAIVEYAYFGRSGKRVARCLEELKSLLGDKAILRYLRSLDPDLRTQFVERFQGSRRDADSAATVSKPKGEQALNTASTTLYQTADPETLASNVVPITQAARLCADKTPDQTGAADVSSNTDTDIAPVNSGDLTSRNE